MTFNLQLDPVQLSKPVAFKVTEVELESLQTTDALAVTTEWLHEKRMSKVPVGRLALDG